MFSFSLCWVWLVSTNAICPELYINTIKPYCLLHVNMFDINFIKCVYKTRFINTFRFLMIFVILNNNLNLFTKKSKIQDTNLGRYSIDFELMGVWITNKKKSSSVSEVMSTLHGITQTARKLNVLIVILGRQFTPIKQWCFLLSALFYRSGVHIQ